MSFSDHPPRKQALRDSGVKGYLIMFLELLQLVANDELFDFSGVVQSKPVVQVPEPDDHTAKETHTAFLTTLFQDCLSL